jgi:type IV pilus assembly protein PilW
MRTMARDLAGFTLIELMVALVISSFLLYGAIDVFAEARTAYRSAESTARLQETLRFAMNMLVEDVRLAHYWGRADRAGRIERGPSARVTCGGHDVTAWALDFTRGIETRDEHYDLPCPGADPRASSDVIIVRHANPETTAPDAGAVQIQSNGSGGMVFSSGNRPSDFSPGGEIFDLVINAWYIGNQSRYDANMPALRRRSLVRGVMQDQEIIAGVDALQVRLGIDTNGDQLVDTYLDSNAVNPERRIVAVRIRIEARTEPGSPPQRAALTRTIMLRNAGG